MRPMAKAPKRTRAPRKLNSVSLPIVRLAQLLSEAAHARAEPRAEEPDADEDGEATQRGDAERLRLFEREAEQEVGGQGERDEEEGRAEQAAEDVDDDMISGLRLAFSDLAVAQAGEAAGDEFQRVRYDEAEQVADQQDDGRPHPFLRWTVEVHGPGLELVELLLEFHA